MSVNVSDQKLSPIASRYLRRDDPGPFQITPRIVALLAALHRFDRLTSHQLARVDGGSQQKVLRLLQRCFDHELVDRVGAAQLTPATLFFDCRPLVYSLARKGAKVLASAGMSVDVNIDRTTRNKRAILIEHAIGVAEAMFRWDADCAALGLQLIDQHQLLETVVPEATRAMPRPLRLQVDVRPGDFPQLARLIREPVRVGVEHDRLFALLQSDHTGWGFGLEWDRGTERIVPSRLAGTSFLRKQLAIYSAWRSGTVASQWGFKSFRCLTVTTSETRVRSMIESQQTLDTPPGLFLYTTSHQLLTEGPLSPIWCTSKRDRVSLLD